MELPDPDKVPLRPDYGEGMYRRRIRLTARPGHSSGALEDDFHCVRVDVRHDRRRVTEVHGETLRIPWTTCPEAVDALEHLRGLELTISLRTIARHTNPRAQCTHLFDVASLAIAHAASGRRGRTYDIGVPDRVDGRTRVTLDRDGRRILAWNVEGTRILAPDPYTGRSMARGGFNEWAESELDPDTAEAAWVLRRACFIGFGRRYDFDGVRRAAAFGTAVGGACHTFSPTVVSRSQRIAGSHRDFSESPEKLLREVESQDSLPQTGPTAVR